MFISQRLQPYKALFSNILLLAFHFFLAVVNMAIVTVALWLAWFERARELYLQCSYDRAMYMYEA